MLSEFEIKRYKFAKDKFLAKRRPHPTVRAKCDLGCRLEKETVEIFEIRPQWDDPATIQEYSIAKATYIKSQKVWEIYWMQGNLKWKKYEVNDIAKTIEDAFTIIDCDEYGVFFG
jgi:hypothetical protein